MTFGPDSCFFATGLCIFQPPETVLRFSPGGSNVKCVFHLCLPLRVGPPYNPQHSPLVPTIQSTPCVPARCSSPPPCFPPFPHREITLFTSSDFKRTLPPLESSLACPSPFRPLNDRYKCAGLYNTDRTSPGPRMCSVTFASAFDDPRLVIRTHHPFTRIQFAVNPHHSCWGFFGHADSLPSQIKALSPSFPL